MSSSSQEIINNISKKMYSDYKFLGLSFEEFKKIVIIEISKINLNFTTKNDYLKFIKETIKTKFDKLVQEKLNNQEECIFIVENYVNLNFNNMTSYDKALNNLNIKCCNIHKENNYYAIEKIKGKNLLEQVDFAVKENDEDKVIELLDNYGSKEVQAQRIGLNSNIVKGVIEDSNSINLGYLSSKDSNFNSTVEEYLNVVNSSLINTNNYL